jgi:hypothetical protein
MTWVADLLRQAWDEDAVEISAQLGWPRVVPSMRRSIEMAGDPSPSREVEAMRTALMELARTDRAGLETLARFLAGETSSELPGLLRLLETRVDELVGD